MAHFWFEASSPSRSHDSVWFWIHLIMRTLLNFKTDGHGKLWYSEHHKVFGDTFTFWFPCLPHIYIDSNTPQQCQEFIHRYCENLSQCYYDNKTVNKMLHLKCSFGSFWSCSLFRLSSNSVWSYHQAYYREGGLQPCWYEYNSTAWPL